MHCMGQSVWAFLCSLCTGVCAGGGEGDCIACTSVCAQEVNYMHLCLGGGVALHASVSAQGDGVAFHATVCTGVALCAAMPARGGGYCIACISVCVGGFALHAAHVCRGLLKCNPPTPLHATRGPVCGLHSVPWCTCGVALTKSNPAHTSACHATPLQACRKMQCMARCVWVGGAVYASGHAQVLGKGAALYAPVRAGYVCCIERPGGRGGCIACTAGARRGDTSGRGSQAPACHTHSAPPSSLACRRRLLIGRGLCRP